MLKRALLWFLVSSLVTAFEDVQQDCKEKVEALEESLLNQIPIMKPISDDSVGLNWKTNLPKNFLSCLESVEFWSEENVLEKIDKSNINDTASDFFSIPLDICREDPRNLSIVFHVKTFYGPKRILKTNNFSYTPGEYFLPHKLPPFCLKDRIINVSLSDGMTTLVHYRHCLQMVEVCQCNTKKVCGNCDKIYQSFGEHAGRLEYQVELENSTVALRLVYFRTNKVMHQSRISTMAMLQLSENPCEDTSIGDFSFSSSDIIHVISISIGVAIFFFILFAMFVIYKKKTRKRNDRLSNNLESIDQNPDYGYSNHGVDYEESVLKHTNLEYAYSVTEPDYIDSKV